MILVIGSRGFIGRALCLKLREKKLPYLELNSDNGGVLDKKNFEKFEKSRITHVFHLGAKTYIPESWLNPSLFHGIIAEGTANVLVFCKEQLASLTFVSAYIYGNQANLPIREDQLPVKSNPYAHAKLIAEKHCEYFRDFLDLKVNVIRPFNVYGPGQNERFLIPRLLRQAMGSDNIELDNTLTRRDYVYIDDLVDALLCSMKFKGHGDVYNVASGRSTSVADLISTIESLLMKNIKVRTENVLRENEIMDTVASIVNIQNDLDWKPKTNLKEGIERIVNVMIRNGALNV